MADTKIELREQEVRDLVDAALQVDEDRSFPGLTDDERDAHLDALVRAAVQVALAMGMEIHERELSPAGRGPSGGNYV